MTASNGPAALSSDTIAFNTPALSTTEGVGETEGQALPRTAFTKDPNWYSSDRGGRKQVVIAGTLRVAGYDLETGKELWTVRGLARTICATPVVGDEGRLYLSGWAAGGELADEPAEPAVVAAMLLGPMLFRRLMQDQPVSPELIEQALDSAVTWRERPAAG